MKYPFKNSCAICLLSIFIFSTSCNKEPDRALVISKLKNSAKLATVEYIVTKVISAKVDKNWFAKDAYFFAETQATIKAGIDLEKLKEDDIKIEGRKISIKLPPVEILNFSYPAEGYKVIEKYSDESSIFKWNSLDVADKDELYRQGETDIRAYLNDLGIIKTAQTNTRLLLKKILTISGFDEIYIEFSEGQDKIETQDKQILNDLKEFFEKNKK